MAQDPFKTDQVQIAPGTTGTRLIKADSAGRMVFQDIDATAGATLRQIAAVAVDGLYVVGPSGVGAAYTSVKAAVDAARSARLAATWTGPVLVLVFPGTYYETAPVVVDFDDVTIQGLGKATVALTGTDDDVIVVKAYSSGGVDLRPWWTKIAGLRISCDSVSGKACVHVQGGDVSGSPSEVGKKAVILDDLAYVTSGTGVAVFAESANHIRIVGGTAKKCAGSTAQFVVDTCASLNVLGLGDFAWCQLSYDSGHDQPVEMPMDWWFRASSLGYVSVTNVLVTFLGCNGGTLAVAGTSGGAVVIGSRNDVITAAGSVAVSTFGSFGTVVPGDATVELSLPNYSGEATLPDGETDLEVEFGFVRSDSYDVNIVMVDPPYVPWGVIAKTPTAFTVRFSDTHTSPRLVRWSTVRAF